jgi:hypothetical protein
MFPKPVRAELSLSDFKSGELVTMEFNIILKAEKDKPIQSTVTVSYPWKQEKFKQEAPLRENFRLLLVVSRLFL